MLVGSGKQRMRTGAGNLTEGGWGRSKGQQMKAVGLGREDSTGLAMVGL